MLRTASSLPLYRASDAGLRPGPFPGRAASPLPGLLAATRTGLPPAGDDKLTNTKIHHGLTSRCHLLLCWAHEITSLLGSVSKHGANIRQGFGGRPTGLTLSNRPRTSQE